MAQSSREAAVVRVRNVPPRALRSREGRSDRVLQRALYIRDGKDINMVMIEVGLAEVYRGPESGNPYKLQYQAAEETARAAKKGMWVLGDTLRKPTGLPQASGHQLADI